MAMSAVLVGLCLLCLPILSLQMSVPRDSFSSLPKSRLLKAYADLISSRRETGKVVLKPPQVHISNEDVLTAKTGKPGKSSIERDLEGVPTQSVQARRPILSGGSGLRKIRNQGKQSYADVVNPNRLRIIAGVAKGKKIQSPDVYLSTHFVWFIASKFYFE